jgi:Domain of unknown function (DUF4426)
MKHPARSPAPRAIATGLLLALLACAGRAELRQFGSFEVHYSVFGSSFLQPDIAAAYGIVRAKDRAVINIAIRRGAGDAATVPAVLTGTRGDLIRKTPLEFREIREQQAVYYIAEFGFLDGETQYFELEIRPAGEAQPLALEFSQVLYAD